MFDTVISVRAQLNPRGTWGQLARRAGEYQLISSTEMAAELAEVIARSGLQERLARSAEHTEYAEVLGALRNAEVVENVQQVTVCRDQADDMFFACAVAGGADYIVSEDEDILAVAEYEGVKTIRASAVLKLLDKTVE